jgi:RNase H-like domain found in reverse transcriptase
VSWSAAMEAAFAAARSALSSTALLDHPAADAKLSLITAASASHISGVLKQRPGQHWQPLGFHSQKLSTAEELRRWWLEWLGRTGQRRRLALHLLA